MAQLYFTRYTQVYLEFDGKLWEIPVLDGFSFSQATNSSEVTLNEMESTAGVSRRGRRAFNDSLAPADWSFSTYMRPFASSATQGNSGPSAENFWVDSGSTAGDYHCVEEALWALMAGAKDMSSAMEFTNSAGTSKVTDQVLAASSQCGADCLAINFDSSNIAIPADTCNIYMLLGDDNFKLYRLSSACVNEASIDFDVDGIATINWSGYASEIEDVTADISHQVAAASAPSGTNSSDTGDYMLITDDGNRLYRFANTSGGVQPTITEAITATDNFIRNRLTQLSIEENGGAEYTITITGGNITISNNINYLTPEELGTVNVPIAAILGARSVSGSFNAYMDDESTGADGFYKRLLALNTTVTNNFSTTFKVGGTDAGPKSILTLGTCHVEIPTHDVSDLISVSTNFMALPSTIDETDEIIVEYTTAAL